jgi:DNA-directed RNA polymerase alpha subunit
MTAPAVAGTSTDFAPVKDLAKMKVEELELGSRITSALTDAGIKSVAGLIKKTASSLLELDGVGDKALSEISEALAAHGLTLKGE